MEFTITELQTIFYTKDSLDLSRVSNFDYAIMGLGAIEVINTVHDKDYSFKIFHNPLLDATWIDGVLDKDSGLPMNSYTIHFYKGRQITTQAFLKQ